MRSSGANIRAGFHEKAGMHLKQTLQNAVTATDQQIDALVYELYGLTEKEIKLVEGSE